MSTRNRKVDERGAMLILVGLLLVALFGFGALAVDIAALVQERRTLQNGADAGALAVAKDCAEGDCGADPTGMADDYADDNADDGQSNIDEVCGTAPDLPECASPPSVDLPAGAEYVQVRTSTFEVASPGNPTEVNFKFAPVMSAFFDGKTVHATAVAAYGPIQEGLALPLTISVCEWEKMGSTPQEGPPFSGDPAVLMFHDATVSSGLPPDSCPAGPAGADIPGGFGWLENIDCDLVVSEDSWAGAKTGVSLPNGCDPKSWRNKVVRIPIFDDVTGTGTTAKYHLKTFAAFYVTGYRFPGASGGPAWPPGFSCGGGGGGGGGTCLRGYFTTDAGGEGELGGEEDFGVHVVKLVE